MKKHIKRILLILVGTAVASFGIYNIHQQTQITEGGVLGMILLVNHWFGISPSIITTVLDLLCYTVAFYFLGGSFIGWSMMSTLAMSGFFRLWEQVGPVLPDLTAYPLIAAVMGALFVGVGVGMVIKQGGSSGGDDALALTISHVFRWRISKAYLFTDVTVLALSVSYIPLRRIAYSLITVTISSLLIDVVKEYGGKKQEV